MDQPSTARSDVRRAARRRKIEALRDQPGTEGERQAAEQAITRIATAPPAPVQDQRLTDFVVRRLPAPAKGNRVTYDAAVKGFGARITAAGARAFVLRYRRRSDGKDSLYTIGSFPDWSVSAARDEAKRLKRLVDGGGDPVGEQREQRGAPTFNELADRFEREHLPKKRASTQRDYVSILKCHLRPALGRRKVASIEFADGNALHLAVTRDSGPRRANTVIAVLSKMLSLAVRWKLRSDNPCRGLERNDEVKRKRYLAGDELARLSKALAEHDDRDAADIFRLLLLTGARRGEVQAARWRDINLETGVWCKPGAATKQRTDHVVPLSKPALALIATRRRKAAETDEYLFPGRHGGHRIELKNNWRRVCAAAKITGLRIHDLRHSYASSLASAGIGLPVIGALLGHATAQTTHRYAHLFDDPLRAATERAGAIIGRQGLAQEAVLTKRKRKRDRPSPASCV
jgi:integrase